MAYDPEIDEMYTQAQEGLLTYGLAPLKSTELRDLILFLTNLYAHTLDKEDDGIKPDDDLFARGLESLASSILSARLKAAFRNYGIESKRLDLINNRLLYSATTIRRMSEALAALVAGDSRFDEIVSSVSHEDVEKLVTKFESELPRSNKNDHVSGCARQPILLTGSTGKLGLSEDQYSTLSKDTTSIIHNAFPVNFLLGVLSFEPQIQALVNLLKLGPEGDKMPPVLFVSSIAAAIPVTGSHQIVPEAVLSSESAKDLLQQGYAQAKHVCERLLERYSALSEGRKAAVLRVGQICGPISGSGVWKVWEWAPSLVVSSKFLGVAPDSLGDMEINWIPVDKLGHIVAELTHTTSAGNSEDFTIYNVVNPTATPWKELLLAVKIAPATVPPKEWVYRLEASDNGTHLINENPALKLVEFYKQAILGEATPVKVEMENLSRGSQTAKGLSPIKEEHMARWMTAWGL